MADRFGLRFVTVFGGLAFSIAMAAPAIAQVRIDRDQTGRVVAITGLPTSSGCVRGTGTGRVVDRVVEKGELQGFTFNEPPYDDSYINLPAAYDIRDRAAYARLQAAFDDLFRKGARLKVSSVACGAAGKIVKLVSATLVDTPPAPRVAPAPASAPATPSAPPAAPPPPAPALAEPMDALLRSPDSPSKPAAATTPDEPPPAAPEPKSAAESPSAASPPKLAVEQPPPAAPRKPSRWQLTQPTKVQVDLRIQSEDRAFRFLVSCQKGSKRGVEISNWFLPPGNWSISNSATPASIDGRPQRWQVGGADEGLVFSDGESDGMVTLSPGARDQLARGQRFVVSGRMDRGGRPREAVFDISNSEEVFAAFDARCRAFRR